jgi:hypothetical protein
MKAIIFTMLFSLTVSFSLFAQTKDEVVALLHEIDDRSTRFNQRIISVAEFNFGIPGGRNWIVQWENNHPTTGRLLIDMVYVIDIDAREMLFWQEITRDRHLASHYTNLHGRTIGNARIGDFNGKGYDMILSLGVSGMGSFFTISGFNPQVGRIEQIFFENFDGGDERPPVRFVTYRGMQGFIFRFFDPPQVAGGPTWTPDPPDPRDGRWFFYRWDTAQRTFVEVGEVDEAYIEGDWRHGESPADELIQEENAITAYQLRADAVEETTPIVTATVYQLTVTTEQPLFISQSGVTTNPLWMWIIIAGGVAVVGGIVLFVARRRSARDG